MQSVNDISFTLLVAEDTFVGGVPALVAPLISGPALSAGATTVRVSPEILTIYWVVIGGACIILLFPLLLLATYHLPSSL
jgi:hypothetical protein